MPWLLQYCCPFSLWSGEQRSAFIGSVWVFRPSPFSNELWGPPKVIVSHQIIPSPSGAEEVVQPGTIGGGSSYSPVYSSAPRAWQEKRHDWILTLISPCMPSRMGLSFFYRILGAMDISLVDTSLAGFLSIHLLIDLLIICHMLNLNSTASVGKLCLLLQWCLVWILALPPTFLWISFIFPEGRILYPPFPGLRKDELK